MNNHNLHLQAYFSEIANHDTVDFVAQEIATRLINNLAMMRITPTVVLDIGCGTGNATSLLKSLFPKTTIIGIDIALPMIKKLPKQTLAICAYAEKLPIAVASVDIIVMNLLLPWCQASQVLFNYLKQILKPNGLLIFSAYGPKTCQEIRNLSPLNFLSLLEIGDLLQKTKFTSTVMEKQLLTVCYKNHIQLWQDLHHQGLTYFIPSIDHMAPLSISYEIILGHAWYVSENHEASVPVNKIFRRPYSSS